MPHLDKLADGTISYSYNRVNGTIDAEYVSPDRIEAYIEDEVFWETVKNSYKDIDLSNKKDKERFLTKRQKTADWLRKQANGIYF